jgi:hypothetical protein
MAQRIAYFKSAGGPSASTSYVDNAVLGLAGTTYVDSAVSGLAATSYVDSAVSGLAQASDLATLGGQVTTLSGTVSGHTTAIASKAGCI